MKRLVSILKLIAMILALSMLLCSCGFLNHENVSETEESTEAPEITSGDYVYVVKDGNAVIRKYLSTAQEVQIWYI